MIWHTLLKIVQSFVLLWYDTAHPSEMVQCFVFLWYHIAYFSKMVFVFMVWYGLS